MSASYAPTRYKLTVDDYHKLGEVGILNEDSRVELIDGELIRMPPVGAPHMWVVNRLTKLLVLAAGDDGVVSVQNPVTIPPWSEPQPDVTILRAPARDADPALPQPPDVLLLVEVADTTLAYDRGKKRRLYAKSGVAEFWIVDVNARCIEMYREPGETGYAWKGVCAEHEVASPAALPRVRVPVAEILG
jgi:Uma2 family endonuclease